MTGTELKVRRTEAHLKAKDVAALLEWSASKISRIERLVHVEPEDAARYVAAVATLTTDSTSEAVA